jgi:hypothetical protein
MAGRTVVSSPGRENDRAESAPPAVASSPTAELLVSLQRSAGNAAVSALIARDDATGTAPAPAPTPAPAPPPDKTGIGSPFAIGRFVAVAKKVETDWAKLKPVDRAKAFAVASNAELTTAGAPAAKVKVKKMDDLGRFSFSTWTLNLGKDAFGAATPSSADIMDAADTVYHETRHAEQWFRMARLQAGKGWKAAKIAIKLSIPLKIAKAAEAAPLTGTSLEASEASSWYESVYGSGAKARNKTLTDLSKVPAQLEKAIAALAKLEKNPKATAKQKEAAQKKVDELTKKSEDTDAAYHALPEEADAWAVGADVQTEYILFDRI